MCGFCHHIRKHIALYHDLLLKKFHLVCKRCFTGRGFIRRSSPQARGLKTTLTLILASDYERHGLRMRLCVCHDDDTTLKQIAAAKPKVNNGNTIWI
jgi:hypothetical protein